MLKISPVPVDVIIARGRSSVITGMHAGAMPVISYEASIELKGNGVSLKEFWQIDRRCIASVYSWRRCYP